MDSYNQEDNDIDDINEIHLDGTPTSQAPMLSPTQSKHLDPKSIAEEFIAKEKSQKEKSQSKISTFFLSLITVIMSVVLFWMLNLQREIRSIKTELNITPLPNENGLPVVPTVYQSISVVTPEEFAEVDGQFEISFEVEGSNFVGAKLFDDSGVELGSTSIDTSASLTEKFATKLAFNVTKSPTTNNGYLIVYPGDKSINSPVSKTITLAFKGNGTVNKLNLIGPLSNQLINSMTLQFIGEMKGFTGNDVGFLIKDIEGKELSEGVIELDNTKENLDFIKFDKSVSIGTLPSDKADKGTINFYDLSNKDEVVLSLPVRFK